MRNYTIKDTATTLNGGITAAATSLTIAGKSANYPTEDFTIVLSDDAATPSQEVVLVGSRSGETLSNLTRGFDGSTAQAWSSGDFVECMVVAADMYHSEAAWTPPPSSGWSWVNQGSSTITSNSNPTRETLKAVHTGTSTNLVARVRSYTAPATVTARLSGSSWVKDYLGFGLSVRDSGTGELVDFDFNASSRSTQVTYMNSATSYGSTPVSSGYAGPSLWARIEDNNTNLIFSVSPNGWDWVEFASLSRTAHLTTPNQFGFQASTQNSSSPNLDTILSILSWEVT